MDGVMAVNERQEQVGKLRPFVAPAEGIATVRVPMDDTARVLIRGIEVGADLDLSLWEMGPGSGTEAHIHHLHDEDFFMLSGELIRGAGGSQQILRPGSLASGPKGVPHAFVNRSGAEVQLLTIHAPAGHIQFFEDLQAAGVMEAADETEMVRRALPAMRRHQVTFGAPGAELEPVDGRPEPFYAPPGGIRSFSLLEDDVRILMRGKETGAVYDALQFTVPPGGGPGPHVHHEHDEIFYMLQGELTVDVGDQRFVVKEGMTLFAPRGVPHDYRNTGEGAAQYLLLLTPAGHVALFEDVAALDIPQDPQDLAAVVQLMAKHRVEIVEGPLGA